MNITEQVEIHFHQQEQVSIYLESTASSNQAKLGEVALCSMYAIRMLSNLGANETSNNLASFLAGGNHVVQAFATGASTGGFDLIPYPGSYGRKRFLAKLTLTDSAVRFDLKPKGFGLLATGVGYYGPISVFALLRFLAQQRSEDADFLDSLGRAVAQCGQAHLAGQITLTNHYEILLAILAAHSGRYLNSEQDGSNTMKSNEIPEWDRITSEADSHVCTVLKTFVSSRLQDNPTGEKMFLLGRDALYAYFCGATSYISSQLDGELARYKSQLLSLQSSSYLKLLCALHTSHVVTMLLANPTSQKEQSWFYLLSEGICDIYNQPDEYMRDWFESLQYLADGPSTRIAYRTYDEIAPILKLSPNDPREVLSWGPIQLECVSAMRRLFDDPEWRASIDAKLK